MTRSIDGSRLSVGVVIRALNEERHIGRLLTGLAHQTLQPDAVVVVDSGSTDATVEIARRFEAEVVTIAPEVFSFGRSLNLGCSAVDTNVIIVASAHVYPVYTTWIEHLVAPFADDRLALSYGRQVGDERSKFAEQQLFQRWFPIESVANQTHPFCNNANAAVRRAVWAELPYDEELTGLEDLDWARRALSQGHSLSYVAEAPVVHVHEESWSRMRNRYRREAMAHRRIFSEQRMSWREAVELAGQHTVSDLAAARRQGKLLANLVAVPAFHAAQFLGAYEGFRDGLEASDELRRRFYYPARDGACAPAVSSDDLIDYSEPEEGAP